MRKITPLALIALTIVLLYFALSGSHGYFHLMRGEKQALALTKKTESLDRDMSDLRKRIQEIQDEPQALEKQAREEIGFAKPGETLYIFPTRRKEEAR